MELYQTIMLIPSILSVLTALGYIFVVLAGDKTIYRNSERRKEKKFKLAFLLALATSGFDLGILILSLSSDSFRINMPINLILWIAITVLAFFSIKNWKKRYDEYERLGKPEWLKFSL